VGQGELQLLVPQVCFSHFIALSLYHFLLVGFMETLELIVRIATVLALLSVSALCLYAIVALRAVRSLTGELQAQIASVGALLKTLPSELQELHQRLLAIAVHIEETSKNTANITQKLSTDLQGLNGLFGDIQALRLQIREFRVLVGENVVAPLRQLSTLVSAAVQGVTAFLQSLQRR
jgi:hypothetical protein